MCDWQEGGTRTIVQFTGRWKRADWTIDGEAENIIMRDEEDKMVGQMVFSKYTKCKMIVTE